MRGNKIKPVVMLVLEPVVTARRSAATSLVVMRPVATRRLVIPAAVPVPRLVVIRPAVRRLAEMRPVGIAPVATAVSVEMRSVAAVMVAMPVAM